ncbi:MAG TPA: methylated-DNA--[protein]-cysteine S-methyltransferase, partial [Vicinamibacterales bacterium]
ASSGREAARQAVLAGQTASRSAPADPPKREREGGQVGPSPDWNHDDAAFGDVVSQLGEYFEGRRRQFDLPLAPAGTPFQQRVWSALLDIAYGETISYGELASRIGQKSASRAVGLANGSNPLPIVIPCHRVIGANGKLTGYGGGLPIKERLLAHERGERRLL